MTCDGPDQLLESYAALVCVYVLRHQRQGKQVEAGQKGAEAKEPVSLLESYAASIMPLLESYAASVCVPHQRQGKSVLQEGAAAA